MASRRTPLYSRNASPASSGLIEVRQYSWLAACSPSDETGVTVWEDDCCHQMSVRLVLCRHSYTTLG